MDNDVITNEQNLLPKKKPSTIKIILYIFVGIIAVLAFIRSLNPDNNIIGIDGMREAYGVAKQVIQEEFTTDVKFPKFKSEFIPNRYEKFTHESKEYHLYTVNSYFNVKNIFNTDVRDEYVIKIGLPVDKDGDYYYEIIRQRRIACRLLIIKT